MPEDLRRAGFEFVLRVDPDDEVAESDENDNTISTRVPLPPVRRPFPVAVPIAAGGVVAAAAIGWAVARLLAGARAAPGPAAEPRSADVKSAEPPGEEMKSAEPPEPREASAGELPKGAVAGTYGGKRARDDVYFTVTSPAEVAPRASLVVNVWAHVDAQRDEVLKRARQAEPGPEPLARSKGPFGIARDTELDVLLTIEDCTVESDKDTIRWTGAIANADFLVRVSDRAAEGNKAGCASVLYRGLEVARVRFLLKVTTAPAAARAEATGRPHRKAFASYARADAHDVLTCIQGMEKALPDLKVFVDVLRFRSGQYWQTTLQQEIMASDVFYLFWSKAARDSEWVNKEWRYGFDQKGLDFIDPVPLVSPREVPPPPELADRHFDDWELAFKSYLGKPAGPP
ncbi:toll/interleukin-1 receptor domain-containing protein [candidate division WOR-3 bacterium]|nr:toll/interleukin-1 receptor domain-containing protein [candidate division WOR-3 bacterium]